MPAHRIRLASPPGFTREGVAEVQPPAPIIAKDSTEFVRDFEQRVDVLIEVFFEADLPVNAVVAQPEVRRSTHRHMD